MGLDCQVAGSHRGYGSGSFSTGFVAQGNLTWNLEIIPGAATCPKTLIFFFPDAHLEMTIIIFQISAGR